MTAYVAFLRAINLGAKRKFGKDQVKAAVEQVGGREVLTYLNTGNVRFEHDLDDPEQVRTILEQTFAEDRGFDVPTVLLSPQELVEVATTAAELDEKNHWAHSHYIYLLQQPWQKAAAETLQAHSTTDDQLLVIGRGAHQLIAEAAAYRTSRFTINKVESHLGIATNRSARVVTTLANRWG